MKGHAMKRWTFRILICLLLGVVTTVGVAWGLALLRKHLPVSATSRELKDEEKVTVWHEFRHLGSITCSFGHYRDPRAEAQTEFTEPPYEWAHVTHRHRMVRATGLPMFALLDDEPVADTSDLFADHRLPLRPILPGFIINTFFYAAIWFGVFFGVAALRRFVREKRGRCVKCGYDLRSGFAGEERGCPECGWGRSG